MKVLYISHHREQSGWGEVALNNILALDSVGVDVVPRAVKLDNPRQDIPQRIFELEQKSAKDCDICLQHVLPHFLQGTSAFKRNIALYEFETTNMAHTSWPRYINMMNEAWVPCLEMHLNQNNNGIKIPSRVIPHAHDPAEYTQTYQPLDIPGIVDNYVFYFIGEYSKRKNITALIRAFYTEFSNNEPVSLVVKVNKTGIEREDLFKQVDEYITGIKQGLKLYKNPNLYKQTHIITEFLSRQQILQLHHTCDCFVMPSHGESWCAPVVDAMAMGNLAIATQTGGMIDYMNSDNGFLVPCNKGDVFAHDHVFDDFGSAKETWANISIIDLRHDLRQAYELNENTRTLIQANAKKVIDTCSLQVVGELMKKALNE